MAGYLSKGFCTLESISDIVQTFLEVAGHILIFMLSVVHSVLQSCHKSDKTVFFFKYLYDTPAYLINILGPDGQ